MVSNKSKEDALLLSLESVDDSWDLDYGASFHATPHRGYFIDYVQGDFGLVYLGYYYVTFIDDAIGVILSEETCRKSSGGFTLGSALNAQRRGRTTKRGNNFGNHGKSRGNSKGNMSQSRGLRDC